MSKKNTKKKKGQKKNLIIIIVAAIVVVILAVVAIVVMNSKLNVPEEINDDYFVSDNNKIVLSLDDKMASFLDGEFEPDITHVVYYCSGDRINNVKVFFVYDDEEEASAAYEGMGDDYEKWASSKELNGKYIIFQDNQGSYEKLSAEEIRDDIEGMKAVNSAL